MGDLLLGLGCRYWVVGKGLICYVCFGGVNCCLMIFLGFSWGMVGCVLVVRECCSVRWILIEVVLLGIDLFKFWVWVFLVRYLV